MWSRTHVFYQQKGNSGTKYRSVCVCNRDIESWISGMKMHSRRHLWVWYIKFTKLFVSFGCYSLSNFIKIGSWLLAKCERTLSSHVFFVVTCQVYSLPRPWLVFVLVSAFDRCIIFMGLKKLKWRGKRKSCHLQHQLHLPT